MASAPIPTPPGLPVLGHLHQIVRSGLVGHLLTVSRMMPDGIFKLRFGSRVSLFVTDPDLVAELSDETRFRKMPGPGLRVVRKFAGDGLFTAFSEEPNWGKAHRILLPAFSQRLMRGYFDMIVEVCDQLVAKWTRAAGTDVLVADDMTRLTLDSIAIAGFGHRFDSFEREELDSFLIALGRSLSEALNTITRLPIQPDDFWMRIRLRQPHERLDLAPVTHASEAQVGAVAGSGQQFAVLYGSSLGTARDIAEEIAERARVDGFDVVVRSMDDSFKGGAAPQDKVVVLVTATYNGRAPDSATDVERALDAGAFDGADWSGARVAVLGIGNSQWPNYQSFPKRIADAVERAGATVIVPRAEADGQGDFDGAVAAFVRDLWKALGATAEPAVAAALSLTPIDAAETRARALPEHAQRLEIVANEEMIRPADGLWDFAKEPPRPSTRLIRVRLAEGQVYHTGDHIAVYARNRPELVDRAVARLGLDPAGQVRVDAQGGRFRHLPLGQTVTVRQLLTDFVELSDAASHRAVATLAAATRCPDTRRKLSALEADHAAAVAGRRVTLIDLLDAHPAAEATLEQLVDWSPAIQPRFYSIASSPMVSPRTADLIVGTMAAPAWSGLGEHRGFASSYMQDVGAGDHVFGYVRRPNPPFAPPEDAGVPMILIGPGTGFAPLRGFLQERARQKADGAAVATSLLFFGCRHPGHDWLCREEMEAWQADGVATLHLAFSAVDAHPWRFVQDALWAAREAVWQAIGAGAAIFVCGDGKFMAPAVRDTLIRLRMERAGNGHSEASAWLEGMIADGRFHQDVFGFGK